VGDGRRLYRTHARRQYDVKFILPYRGASGGSFYVIMRRRTRRNIAPHRHSAQCAEAASILGRCKRGRTRNFFLALAASTAPAAAGSPSSGSANGRKACSRPRTSLLHHQTPSSTRARPNTFTRWLSPRDAGRCKKQMHLRALHRLMGPYSRKAIQSQHSWTTRVCWDSMALLGCKPVKRWSARNP